MSTKLIVLAAGQGTRLRPLTDDRPKCMVELLGKALLEHQIIAAKSIGLSEIHVVTGYRHEMIQYPEVIKHVNPRFATTNMVNSLFVAEDELCGDVVISYGDIVYQPEVLQRLLDSSASVAVVVDKSWQRYWEARMSDPLNDAETLKLRPDETILELGKKAKNFDEIQGQYIGLIKFSADAIAKICSYYHSLDTNQTYDGKDFDNMFMTTFLQLIADNLMPIHAVATNNGWMEVDCPDDLNHFAFLENLK